MHFFKNKKQQREEAPALTSWHLRSTDKFADLTTLFKEVSCFPYGKQNKITTKCCVKSYCNKALHIIMMGTCYCSSSNNNKSSNNKTNKQKMLSTKTLFLVTNNSERRRESQRERGSAAVGEAEVKRAREICSKVFKHHQNALRPNLNVFELLLSPLLLLLRPILIIFTYIYKKGKTWRGNFAFFSCALKQWEGSLLAWSSCLSACLYP